MDLASTTVLLDRERDLRYDYDAIEALSNLPLARRGNRNPLELWGAANGLDLGAMALMIWAGQRHADKRLTVDDAVKILRSALSHGRVTYRELNEALNAAMRQSGVLGLFPADADAASDGENPTTAPMLQAVRPGVSESPAE